QATTSVAEAVRQSEVSFICVGTPSLPNGRVDLSGVRRCCEAIGKALFDTKDFHWIVLRSTMLPGTAESLAIPAIESASGKRAGTDFAVCVNPEFTREGSAVADFLDPAIIVLGANDAAHRAPLLELYQGIKGRICETSLGAAEMVKYVCNSFHALKVAFANEVGTLCARLDVDTQAVMKMFMSDVRLNISTAYLTPGFAFGGSCLPKDLRAIAYHARQLDLNVPLLQSIMPSNQAHLDRAVEAVLATRRQRIAVLGLSFKPGTDDLRESPAVQLIKRLLGEGRKVRVWDPEVCLGRLAGSNRQFIEEEIPHIGSVLSSNLEEVVADAEVVVVSTKAAEIEAAGIALLSRKIVIDLQSQRPAAASDRFMSSWGAEMGEGMPAEASLAGAVVAASS
ncbi:MAG TPA: nucleotide sugar dehydrogenase, partial [Candidatus Saccharimonadales bacterium]|nr:nucleotide sugar dehydrogenase [Candidatus Saccharimonadales bacterium]